MLKILFDNMAKFTILIDKISHRILVTVKLFTVWNIPY
jgi:hypothetical protein